MSGLVGEAEQLVERCRNVSNRAANFQEKQQQELDAICDELMNVLHSLNDMEKRLEQQRHTMGPGEYQTAGHQLSVARNVFQAAGPGGDLRRYLGAKAKRGAGFALTLMIGKQTNVATFSQERLLQVKQEYQEFRVNTAWKILAMSSVLYYFWYRGHRLMGAASSMKGPAEPQPSGWGWGVVWFLDHFKPAATIPKVGGRDLVPYVHASYMPFVMTCVQAFLAWLLYFYAAMTLRENVLRVNGSNIRKWWIFHHYISTLCVLVLLTLPIDAVCMLEFMGPMLLMMAFQGLVMMAQNWYQRNRLYTRIAIGKSGTMDVAAGESSGSSGQTLVLYPILFSFQFLQGYLGVSLLLRFWRSFLDPRDIIEFTAESASSAAISGSELRAMRGLCVVGATLVTLALGNLYSTVVTLVGKMRKVSRVGR